MMNTQVSFTCSLWTRATHFSSGDTQASFRIGLGYTNEPRPLLTALASILAHFHSLLCPKGHRASALLVLVVLTQRWKNSYDNASKGKRAWTPCTPLAICVTRRLTTRLARARAWLRGSW